MRVKLLGKLLARHFAVLVPAMVLCGLTAAVTLCWNTLLSGVIDGVSHGTALPVETLYLALGIMLAMGLTGFGKAYASGWACESLTHALRMGYARRLLSLPYAQVEQVNVGETFSRMQNELADASGFLGGELFQLFDDGVQFITAFVWLLCMDPVLTLAANLPAFLLMGYIYWSSKVIGTATERSQAAKGEMNRYADTLLMLFPVIRLYDASRLVLDGYLGAIGAWKRDTLRLERKKAWLLSLSGVLSCLPLLLLLLVGGHRVLSGALSVGTLYVFINLSGNVSGVLMNMPGHIAALRRFTASMGRLSPHILLDAKGERA